MRKLMLVLCLIAALSINANAADFTAPEAPEDVQDLLPYENATFAQGLWHILRAGFETVHPKLTQCLHSCIRILTISLLLGMIQSLPRAETVILAGKIAVACILLEPTDTLITQAADTIVEMGEYGKLLLPVMTGVLAAQGGGGTATALYAGTAFFTTLLASLIANLLIPLVYIFLALSLASAVTQDETLQKLSKWMIQVSSKGLRIILYVFTGYLTITGVISGAADQMAIKAAKLTISSMIPVVGNIMADASETILVSAGIAKGAIGIYGLWTMIALGISPMLSIGAQYLSLKATGAACSLFSGKAVSNSTEAFASAMGLLLAMTGTMCLLIMISTVCFMKGLSG
jgi:stage III sporulation protein AE